MLISRVHLYSRCSLSADLVEVSQDAWDYCSINVLSLEEEKSLGIFYCLVATLSLVWCHGVSSIADDDRPALDIGRKRILVAKLPEADVLGLS